MNIVESSHQVKHTLDDAMSNPEYVNKISDKVNEKLREMGYSDQKIRTFLLQKQLKLDKKADRMDVTLNGRHLFYVVVSEFKAGSYKSFGIDVVE